MTVSYEEKPVGKLVRALKIRAHTIHESQRRIALSVLLDQVATGIEVGR